MNIDNDYAKIQIETDSEIESRIDKTIEQLIVGFRSAIELAKNNYSKLSEEHKKGKLANIYISYLRSSVLLKLPLFRIDLYDDKDRTKDLIECYVYWDIGDTFNHVYNNVRVKDVRFKGASEPDEPEIEHIWIEQAMIYFSIIEKHMADIIDKAFDEEQSEINFYYGEFMDKVSKIK